MIDIYFLVSIYNFILQISLKLKLEKEIFKIFIVFFFDSKMKILFNFLQVGFKFINLNTKWRPSLALLRVQLHRLYTQNASTV